MPQFRTGTEEAEKAASRSKFVRTEFFSVADGQYGSIRFLTDYNGLITVKQHGNVPTRPAPADFEGKWPQKMGAVCRNDTAFRDEHGNRTYPDCFICLEHERTGDKQYKPTDRSWALAIARKERLEGGRIMGLEDEMIEIEDADGKKKMVPKIVVLNFAYNNFWGGLAGIQQLHGTWLSLDIRVTRKGSELNTSYSFVNYAAANWVKDGVDTGKTMDLRDPEQMAYYMEHAPSLSDYVDQRSNDEFYDRFFDTRHPQPATKKADGVPPSGADAATPTSTAPQPSEEEIAAIAARISGYNPSEQSPEGQITFGS